MSGWKIDELKLMAHVLVGAAHADGQVQMEEEAIILQLLAGLLDQDQLPEEIIESLGAFDPETFDLQETCKALAADTSERRREILSLVAQVTEVDEIHDLDESHYILQVARGIGASPEEYKDLTVDVSSGRSFTPPPIPR
jgi:uncharacterized tellurite resistance protein B-like protein